LYGLGRQSQWRYPERVPPAFVASPTWGALPPAITNVSWPDPTLVVITGLDWTSPDMAEILRVLAEDIKSRQINVTVVLVGTTPPPRPGLHGHWAGDCGGPAQSSGPGVAPPAGVPAQPDVGGTGPRVLEAVAGLEGGEIEQIVQLQLAVRGRLSPGVAAQEKAQRLAQGGSLEIITPDPAGLNGVGGLDGLKQWLVTRREAYTQEAQAFGLPQPKGVLLVGPPGTGKSLAARAVAATWGFPLVRLDIGRLHGSYVGESEKTCGPCSARLMGWLPPWCGWTRWRRAWPGPPVPAVGRSPDACCNPCSRGCRSRRARSCSAPPTTSVRCRPSSCGRAGSTSFSGSICRRSPSARRFSPSTCASGGATPAAFDLAAVADAARGFSGSELEAAIIDGLHRAWAARRDLFTEDVAAALAETKPLSQLFPDAINAVRQRGGTHARPAGQDPQRTGGQAVERLQA